MNGRIKRSLRSQAGVSLVELMFAVAIGGIALSALGMLIVYTARSFQALSNYCELDKNSRTALDDMSRIIREADGVLDYSTNKLALSYHAGTVTYNYNPTTKMVTYTDATHTETNLTGCDFFKFEIFQRNANPGNYDLYPASLDESDAKLVQVSWICSRKLIGKLLNTESVQSAKIVIRKQ